MTDEEASPVFERGDVVYGDDPFNADEAARPWLVLSNHEERPFHGEQYVALTLTTKSWMDGLIDVPEESWVRGGTPDESRIVPWGVQSIDHKDIEFWQGRLESALVDQAVAALVENYSSGSVQQSLRSTLEGTVGGSPVFTVQQFRRSSQSSNSVRSVAGLGSSRSS